MACFCNIQKQNEKNRQILARQFTHQQLHAHPLHSEYRICTSTRHPDTIPMPGPFVDRINQDSQIRQLDNKLHKCGAEKTDSEKVDTCGPQKIFNTAQGVCEFPNLPLPAHKFVGQNENLWNNCTKRRYLED